MTAVLREDLQIISDMPLKWEKLKGASVLITGATGLVGSMLVRALCFANEKRRLGLSIYAAVRDSATAQKILEFSEIRYVCGDICEIACDENVDYIIHCAAVTKSRDMVADPVGNIKTAVNGTQNILDMARRQRVKSAVYLSSKEVYGVTDQSVTSLTEDMLGFVDLKSPRSCYPEGKRICELLCRSYLHQYGVPVKIARLAQTFGAGVSKAENHVYAQFAKSVVNKTDIVLHTDGSSVGNSCYTADAVRAILLLLLEGQNGEAYNIANESASMTIREMAELVAREIARGEISVVFDIPDDKLKYGYAPAVNWKMNADKVKALGWIPQFGMADMYRRMLADWSEQA